MWTNQWKPWVDHSPGTCTNTCYCKTTVSGPCRQLKTLYIGRVGGCRPLTARFHFWRYKLFCVLPEVLWLWRYKLLFCVLPGVLWLWRYKVVVLRLAWSTSTVIVVKMSVSVVLCVGLLLLFTGVERGNANPALEERDDHQNFTKRNECPWRKGLGKMFEYCHHLSSFPSTATGSSLSSSSLLSSSSSSSYLSLSLLTSRLYTELSWIPSFDAWMLHCTLVSGIMSLYWLEFTCRFGVPLE